jgi:UDP-perosamine 4-acetyltransferase
MNKEVVILGAGNVSRYVCYILSYESGIEVVGFVDKNPDTVGTEIRGRPVLGSDEILPDLHRKGIRHAIVGVGDPDLRSQLRMLAMESGFELVNAIHPSAIISPDVRLGKGVVVMAGVVLSDNPVIDHNVWLGLAAKITHDTHIAGDSLIGGGSAVGTHVKIGDRALIGWGAVIGPRLSVGNDAIVGSGANVVRDVPSRAVVVGNPAEIVRYRES